MRVLVTSTRMPYALRLVRALGRQGHEVHGADAYADAPGSQSRYVAGHLVSPPPYPRTAEFVAAIADYSRAHSIDLVVPTFEETFALAARRDELPAETRLFAAPFETLARLHSKASFQELAEGLGLLTPSTTIATDADALRAAAESLPRYIAKPAFSRAGTALITNVGPRTGELSLEQARPSPENPWLVQEFIEGDDLACLAVAREGSLAAYAVYEEPLQGDGGFAMRQVAIDAGPTLGVATTIAEAVGMHGFFGLDYRVNERGPYLIECNARCSPGALLFEDDELADAILGEPPSEPLLIEPGRASQFDDAVLTENLDGLRSIPRAIEELRTAPGPFLDPRDPRGDLFGWLRFRHDSRVAAREHIAYAEQKLGDISWNGEPLT
jgi:ATP-grasp domain